MIGAKPPAVKFRFHLNLPYLKLSTPREMFMGKLEWHITWEETYLMKLLFWSLNQWAFAVARKCFNSRKPEQKNDLLKLAHLCRLIQPKKIGKLFLENNVFRVAYIRCSWRYDNCQNREMLIFHNFRSGGSCL